jgi:hypothetical protein
LFYGVNISAIRTPTRKRTPTQVSGTSPRPPRTICVLVGMQYVWQRAQAHCHNVQYPGVLYPAATATSLTFQYFYKNVNK